MRDLDNRDLVTGDFLVVSGDVVSNVNLGPALAEHRSRRDKDKNAIMTMVLREVGPSNSLRHRQRKPTFVLDPRADRCLHYEELAGNSGGERMILDPEILTSHAEIEILEDLIDPYVDICTPEVLAQWSENFDYQSLRKSFLFGVLKDYELNGKTIHIHVVRDQYIARVANLRAFCVIAKDVLARQVYPFSPDSNLLEDQTYRSVENKVYREAEVRIGRASTIKGSCALGSGTTIGERCSITNSVIGRGCRIEDDVYIENACIWNDVLIERLSTVTGPAIIADRAVIRSKTDVLAGAAIAAEVVIEEDVKIGEVQVKRSAGSQSTARFDDDSDVSSDASLGLLYHDPLAASSQSSISTFASSEDAFEPTDTSRRGSFRSDPSEDAVQSRDFRLEATASILDGFSKGDAADTIFLELNGYRMSVDASQHDMRQAVATALVKYITTVNDNMTSREAVRKIAVQYKSLLERIFLDKNMDQ